MNALLWHSPLRHCAALFLLGAVLIGLASCHKADPDVTEILGATAKADLAKTRLLLNHNPNLVFSKNREGLTALHYAASYGYIEIADLLLERVSKTPPKRNPEAGEIEEGTVSAE